MGWRTSQPERARTSRGAGAAAVGGRRGSCDSDAAPSRPPRRTPRPSSARTAARGALPMAPPRHNRPDPRTRRRGANTAAATAIACASAVPAPAVSAVRPRLPTRLLARATNPAAGSGQSRSAIVKIGGQGGGGEAKEGRRTETFLALTSPHPVSLPAERARCGQAAASSECAWLSASAPPGSIRD
eukprot:364684-Chlamydomonas_euryale.AAC.12